MQYIDKEELKNRLDSERNGSNLLAPENVEVKKYHNGGRRNGVDKIIPMMKPVVGALAYTNGVINTAKAFGISRQRVYELKNARDCHGNPDNDLKKEIQTIRGQVAQTALEQTLSLLGLIDLNKMAGESQRNIISVAKDTSVIYKNMSEVDGPKDNIAKVVIIAPSAKSEEKYEVIDV